MKKQLTISLRQRKTKQDQIQARTLCQNSFSEIKPNYQYRPLGYSAIMNQNRTISSNRLPAKDINEDSIFDIDDKIQKLVEQNERLSISLKSKHSRNQSITAGKICKTENSPPKFFSFKGIDIDNISSRMEKLEYIIESQNKEINDYRSNNQTQSERVKTRQMNEIENLVKKNLLFSEMISQQQSEIESYKHLTTVNQKLKQENQELSHSISVYDQNIDQYEKSQVDTSIQIQDVLNENKRLNNIINDLRIYNQQNYELVITDKEEQIELLLKEIESLSSGLKIEEAENIYLRNMKIDEMKQFISQNNQSQENTNASIKMTEQKSGISNVENSFDSQTSTPFKLNNKRLQQQSRVILGDRQNEITKTLERINSLSSIILKQTKTQSLNQLQNKHQTSNQSENKNRLT